MPNFTENAIKQSFMKLLEERPYSEITVKEIVQDCGINRNSFYYHFQDKPALLEIIIKESLDQIIEEYPSISSLEECLMAAVRFAETYKRSILHIYRSVDRDIFERYLWQICEYGVMQYGETVLSGRKIKAEDKAVLLQYYVCECFGQVMFWMESGMKDDIVKSYHRICELEQGKLEEILRRCEEEE